VADRPDGRKGVAAARSQTVRSASRWVEEVSAK
jgi:hypothetical protein